MSCSIKPLGIIKSLPVEQKKSVGMLDYPVDIIMDDNSCYVKSYSTE